MNAIMLIALANGAIDLGIKLYKASQELPDANSPEALAELKKLETRLRQTMADVNAYQPKTV